MRKIATIIVLLLTSTVVKSQMGILKESSIIKSEILGGNQKYSVYLPAGYEESNRTYPILYLLHGYTDDDRAWMQFGKVGYYADKAISENTASPMIIIMPDAQNTFYINSYDNKTRYEDYFIEELIPKVESLFRVKRDKQYRAIAGLSMGGYGAMLYAIKYPNLFSACAPLSAAIYTEKEITTMPNDSYNQWASPLFGSNLIGNQRLTTHYKNHDILILIQNLSPTQLSKTRYYIDCGDKDFLIEGNMAAHALLKQKAVPHEFRVREGVHNWDYWRTALPNVLKFVSESFNR